MKERIFYLIMAVMLVVTGAFGSLALALPADEAQAQQFTACYEEFGGTKRVAGSGCEYEWQSGATVDIQSGVTYSNAANVTQSGPITVSNNLVVTGTADLQGNVADSGGDMTIADNLAVTGTLDVQGGDITLQNDESISNGTNGTIALGGAVDVTGASLQYGPNDLYPLGVDTSGFEIVWGSEVITGETAITHGLTSPVTALCTMGQAPSAAAGESYGCYAVVSGAVVTVTTVSSDATAATTGATVHWQVIGTP